MVCLTFLGRDRHDSLVSEPESVRAGKAVGRGSLGKGKGKGTGTAGVKKPGQSSKASGSKTTGRTGRKQSTTTVTVHPTPGTAESLSIGPLGPAHTTTFDTNLVSACST